MESRLFWAECIVKFDSIFDENIFDFIISSLWSGIRHKSPFVVVIVGNEDDMIDGEDDNLVYDDEDGMVDGDDDDLIDGCNDEKVIGDLVGCGVI